MASTNNILDALFSKPRIAAVLQGMPTLFDNKQQNADLIATHEAQLEELFAQIGRLTTQVAWLKKKSGLEPAAR